MGGAIKAEIHRGVAAVSGLPQTDFAMTQSKNRLGLDRISQNEESRSNESQLDVRTVDLFENSKASFAFWSGRLQQDAA